jgi:hypothetical protein
MIDSVTANEELRTLRAIIEQLQSCEDALCHVCAGCVTALFVRAPETPAKIPRKYRRAPVFKSPAPLHGRQAEKWNGHE